MRPAAAALLLAVLLPVPALAGEVVVKPGETLSELAERYGTTSERLMQLNGLRSAKDLWAGSTIRVPGASGGSGSRAGVTGGSGNGSGNYTVKRGETLSEIAERYGTTSERLLQLNGLRSGKDLWAGSRIQVPGATRPASSTAARPPLNRNAREYTVQPGETLSEIADRTGIPLSRLVALNGLSKPNELQAGTTLKLRGASPATPAIRTATALPRPAAKPIPRPAITAAAPARPATTAAATIKPAPRPATSAPPAHTTASASAPAPRPTPETPAPKPAAVATATATPIARPIAAAPTPRPAATASSRPATSTASTAVAAAKPSKPTTPDWRSYGPLQVDWANWQPMAGSYVAPSLNSEGKPLYLAVNCSARRLNATGQSGSWKTWDTPQSDFEEQLISDLCKTKGS